MKDSTAVAATRLEQVGVICVTGADARSYLQGQLSFDMERLTARRIELASCNSAQGRVQAVLWLVERSDCIALLLPTSMIDTVVARLRKYTLRAKVKIDPAAERLAVFDAGSEPTATPRSHVERDGVSLIGWPGAQRSLMLASPPRTSVVDSSRQQAWHLADIRAGMPQVYPQTHETFVAQMLNLDLLEGISFEKGCYTGQEIIARTHFRGTVKRRMFRFQAQCPAPTPATRLSAGGQHAGDVVDAAATENGCELLAVVTLAQADAALELDGMPGVKLQRVELPYSVAV
jgi:folate-binding protein YgfZ